MLYYSANKDIQVTYVNFAAGTLPAAAHTTDNIMYCLLVNTLMYTVTNKVFPTHIHINVKYGNGLGGI